MMRGCPAWRRHSNGIRLALACSAARSMQVKRTPLRALGRRVAPARPARSSSRFRESRTMRLVTARSNNSGNTAAPSNARRSQLTERFCGTRGNRNRPELMDSAEQTRHSQTVNVSRQVRTAQWQAMSPNPRHHSHSHQSQHVLPHENFHNGCWCCVHRRRRRNVLNDGRRSNERHCASWRDALHDGSRSCTGHCGVPGCKATTSRLHPAGHRRFAAMASGLCNLGVSSFTHQFQRGGLSRFST